MKRRDFVKVPAAAVVGAVAGGTGLAQASVGSGFRLLEESSRSLGGFELHEFVVECPYPAGSRDWMVIADHDELGRVVLFDGQETVPFTRKVRRVIFPRFTVLEGGFDFVECAEVIHREVAMRGFDNERGSDHEWMVVYVEYRCPDGVERVMAGLPATWDPRLVLGVMEKGQIG